MSSSIFPIALCLLSAITVAATNFFVKRGGDVLSARMLVSLTMAACALPFVAVVPWPEGHLWLALSASVIAHWGYQFAMVRALHRGDLSLVFPVMRGLAPLLTAILGVSVLSEAPSLLGWGGLLMATTALIIFALPERRQSGFSLPGGSALVWAALTAFGIAAYSVTDANGVRLAREQGSAFTFVVWLFLLDWIGISAAMVWSRRGRVLSDLKPQLKGGVIGGVLGAISYGAALLAFTYMDAANVTAIREVSVVFGALFGAIFLKETFGPRRIAAASFLALGLMLLEFAN